MNTLAWIIAGGMLMSAIAMIGGVTTVLRLETLNRLLLPLVSLAAGTLLGGAFFHMIPEGAQNIDALDASVWLMCGFSAFLFLEQFLHWHHSHGSRSGFRRPVTYLILIGDGVHNFLGGVGIASTFIIDPRAGIIAWFAAAAHEVPQELGDFAVLVHGGWDRARALLWNFFSGLTFPLGALLVYAVSLRLDITGLVLFGAGSFIYIAASDLIPEIKEHASLRAAMLNFGLFASGLTLMLLLAYVFQE